MTAPSSIDPARFLHEHLASASPDLPRSSPVRRARDLLAVPLHDELDVEPQSSRPRR
jgi:putative transposase